VLGHHHPPRMAHAAVQFFSFFTIISNLLVTLILTAWALRPPDRRPGSGAARVAAAAVVYILMTGLVYTLFLRQSHASFLGWAVDIVFHHLMPLGYPLFWMSFMPKRELNWRDALYWLILPLVFAGASMVRGAMTAEYTYVFLDVSHLGYLRVSLIILALSLPFLGLGTIVVKVNSVLQQEGDTHNSNSSSHPLDWT